MMQLEESDFEQLKIESMWCEQHLRNNIYRQQTLIFCQLCDKKFAGKVWFEFCSRECFDTYKKETEQLKALHPRPCKFCGGPIPLTANIRRTSCSKKCSDAYYWRASSPVSKNTKSARRNERRRAKRLQEAKNG